MTYAVMTFLVKKKHFNRHCACHDDVVLLTLIRLLVRHQFFRRGC